MANFYNDISLDFIQHPLTNDIVILEDDNAIKQSIRNLLMLERHDIPFDISCFSKIRESLFEFLSDMEASSIRGNIEWQLRRFEPRIILKEVDVSVNHAENGYDISIKYLTKTFQAEGNLTLFFNRIR